MWDRLRKQVEVELEQLNCLIETHRSLLDRCASVAPDPIELSALAALLHSFYTGIENIFKRVVAEIDGALARGETWHRELLDAMTRRGPGRPAVISPGMRDALQEYLNFRHVFRRAYSFELQMGKDVLSRTEVRENPTAPGSRTGYILPVRRARGRPQSTLMRSGTSRCLIPT